jgi:hypothetical protein
MVNNFHNLTLTTKDNSPIDSSYVRYRGLKSIVINVNPLHESSDSNMSEIVEFAKMMEGNTVIYLCDTSDVSEETYQDFYDRYNLSDLYPTIKLMGKTSLNDEIYLFLQKNNHLVTNQNINTDVTDDFQKYYVNTDGTLWGLSYSYETILEKEVVEWCLNINKSNIPKIIHQIWIGDDEMPKHCQEFVERMSILNPGYEHRLWGNEIFTEVYKDDPFLKEYITNPDIYKWAFIADRVRLLLLRDYGGIYCDVDARPIQSFDLVMNKLNQDHTFFSGMKPSQHNNTLVDCTVYGSSPNSRVVNLCLNTYDNIYWANGCKLFSDEIIKYCDTDVALFGHEYFYDNKITNKTVVLHDIEDTRLFTWVDDEDDLKKENW